MLLYVIFITLTFLTMAMWPQKRAHAVEERIAQGDDRFFEEQRSYRAYPSLKSPRYIRITGIIGTICGISICLFHFYHS